MSLCERPQIAVSDTFCIQRAYPLIVIMQPESFFVSLARSLARSVAYFYGRVSFLCLNHSGAAHICDGMPLLFPRHDFIVVCSPSLNNSIFACIRSPNEVSSGRQKRNGESKREVSKGPMADQRRWTFLLTKEKEFFFTLIA